MHICQQPRWHELSWDARTLAGPLADAHREQGRLLGRMEALGFETRREARPLTLTQEVTKSSEIESEVLSADQVRSSNARCLGLDVAGLVLSDRHVDGAAEVVFDATQHFHQALTKGRLFTWRTTLFPTDGRSMKTIKVGAWRDDDTGPMQVVSGPIGRGRVHFEAPPAARLESEIDRFLEWFNEPAESDPAIAEQRLSLTSNGNVRYQMKTPYRDGTTHAIFEPLDFIARLAALVPKPRVNLTRFHGVFAPNSTYRARVTPGKRGRGGRQARTANPEVPTPAERRVAMTWAQRLK